MIKQAYDHGVLLALQEAGLVKEAGATHGVKALAKDAWSGIKNYATGKGVRKALGDYGAAPGSKELKEVAKSMVPYAAPAGIAGAATVGMGALYPKYSSTTKEAGLESRIGGLLGRTAHAWAPAAAGGVAAGPEHRMEGALAGAGLGILGKRMGLGALRRGMFDPADLQKAMRASKLPETGRGYGKLTGLGEGSRKYKRISKELGEEAPEFWKNVSSMKTQAPLYSWGGRLAGGVGGGLLAKELLSGGQRGPVFQTAPAVSDISTHYTGLVPGEEYY